MQDEPALRSFLSELCLEARRLRFFTEAADIAFAAHLAAATDAGQYGLIAHDDAGVLVGRAIYVQLDETRAEVAVEVADYLHGRGLGTILIERLAAVAERRGITRFVAEVLPENRAMLEVFRDGFAAHVTFHDGTDTVEFPTASWRLARERFECRPRPCLRTPALRGSPKRSIPPRPALMRYSRGSSTVPCSVASSGRWERCTLLRATSANGRRPRLRRAWQQSSRDQRLRDAAGMAGTDL
jgi:L-amino acid N-acyltransferase YncA